MQYSLENFNGWEIEFDNGTFTQNIILSQILNRDEVFFNVRKDADRKSTRLNSSHIPLARMLSSA